MNKKTAVKKATERNILLQKIHISRLEEKQELGWHLRPLCICPLPARPLPKRTVILSNGETKPEHETLWSRKAGKYLVEIQGHKDYGIPYGQDILIIIYLAIEAKRQNSRTIKVNFYRDFMRMFGMNPNDGSKYQLVQNSIFRIRNSRFSWHDITKPKNRDKGGGFLYIDDYDLFFNPKDPNQISLFDQYIQISEQFWNEINYFEIPINLDAVRYLKQKTAHLSFYIWLSYRVWYAYHCENGQAIINFWGNNGLQLQTSSQIEERRYFRREVKNYLESVKEVWPLCPVKIINDSLVIDVTSSEQVDIQEKSAQRSLDFPKMQELKPGKEQAPSDKPTPESQNQVSTQYEADFRYFGAKGPKLKEALTYPVEQIERNLNYFKSYLKRMETAGKPLRNPGAFLCAAVIEDYSQTSPLEVEQMQKKEARQREADKQMQAIELTKQKKKEFDALINQKIKDGLAALLLEEREKLEMDFVDLVTQQPVFAEAYQKRGLRDKNIKTIYRSFMGDKFLTEEEQNFEDWMSVQGLEIVE
jgi:hypothetical protein